MTLFAGLLHTTLEGCPSRQVVYAAFSLTCGHTCSEVRIAEQSTYTLERAKVPQPSSAVDAKNLCKPVKSLGKNNFPLPFSFQFSFYISMFYLQTSHFVSLPSFSRFKSTTRPFGCMRQVASAPNMLLRKRLGISADTESSTEMAFSVLTCLLCLAMYATI